MEVEEDPFPNTNANPSLQSRDILPASQFDPQNAPPLSFGMTPPLTNLVMASMNNPTSNPMMPILPTDQGIPASPPDPQLAQNGRIRRHELGGSFFLENDDNNAGAANATVDVGAVATNPTNVKVIWGTNIVISDAIAAFRSFLLSFCPAQRKRMEQEEEAENSMAMLPTITAADLEPLYPRLLRLIHDTRIYNLNLDGANLRAFPATQALHQQLVHYPQEVISLMDMVVNELYAELFNADTNDPIQVRVFNLGPSINMRSLDPADIDKLISIKGLVIRSSNIIPDMRLAHFQCSACGHAHSVEIVRGSIAEPQRCPRPECGAQWSQQLVHNRCAFSDKQLIRLQETPDSIPAGQTPHTVTLCLYDALVDSARPGDRVEVTGIFRSAPVRLNPRQRKMKSLFRTFVDVVHLRRLGSDGKSPGLAAADGEVSAADLMERSGEEILQQAEQHDGMASTATAEEIYALAREPDLYSRLSHSIAPSVWGHDNVKKAMLLQLFGGVSKTLSGSARTRLRGDINVLLTGDPGVSKSQMLQCVHQLAPRGIYTSGKGSSAVGLTAYITRDSETGQLVLESGALVLSDGGICCIDEFDKMSDETRAILHEAMEQQTVSIAKAGIITTLNARSSILASANPVESKFNPNKSLVENINLPPTLLSR